MTEEKIIELAREHLDEFPDDFLATKEELIAFAQAIYDEGYDDGCFQATGGQ
jgi:hypothetical protein